MTYTQQFEQFWKLYPKGCRNDGCGSLQGGKKDAYRAWLGLDAQEKKDAREAVAILKKHQYLPHASRWLRSGMYEAVLENVVVAKTSEFRQKTAWHTKARDDYSRWIKEQDEDTLSAWMGKNPHLVWLVKELRPEMFNAI